MQIDQASKPTVLVVEDEALILYSVAEELRDAGFEVLEAANADVAMGLMETHPEVRILFTDINMPGSMDGLKLSTTVRDRWPPVEIIVTSGHIRIPSESLPVEGHFLPKPYSAAKLISTLWTLAGDNSGPQNA